MNAARSNKSQGLIGSISKTAAAAGAALAGVGVGAIALAQDEAEAHATNGLSMLPAETALATEVHFFHNAILMPIITVISLFVLGLLLWVVVRYNSKANPTPQKFSHNTLIEVIWTGIPILILLVIALFSFDLLYKEDVIPDGKQMIAEGDGSTTTFAFDNDFASPNRRVTRRSHLQVFVESDGAQRKLESNAYDVEGLGDAQINVTLNGAPAVGDKVIIRGGRTLVGRGEAREVALAPSLTLKVNGYQWGWSYSYPDFGDFEYASNMLPEDQTTPALYRLEVDNRVIVPVGETVRVVTTARDVIHSWAMPNFAIKIDAVPGRINETWFKANREGVFYGQCSEICGIKHSFMPIAVEVVSRAEFEAWVDEQRAFVGLDPMFVNDADGKLAMADGQ